jgi:hypothetical protein
MITRERVGTEIGLMTGRIKQTFLNSRDNLASAGTAVSEGTRRAARRTDYFVHDNAWKMLGFAAGLAFVAGFLLSEAREERIVIGAGLDVDKEGQPARKKKSGSFELVHALIPLALFGWKAFQTSRCEKRPQA